jgi:hypothetical protein
LGVVIPGTAFGGFSFFFAICKESSKEKRCDSKNWRRTENEKEERREYFVQHKEKNAHTKGIGIKIDMLIAGPDRKQNTVFYQWS